MRILGIDPGKTGWWCLLDTDTMIGEAQELRFDGDGILDIEAIPGAIDCAWIEKVHVNSSFMPSSSAFSFGFTCGQIHAFLSGLETHLVTPKKWQALCLEGIDEKKENKSRSIAGFVKMNPELRNIKLNHNFTDAFHIARYGCIKSGTFSGRFKWPKPENLGKLKKS